ncbi:hypothetical protein ATCC90586_012176 [Pythium insidiosum]|nr:hypothetical protein ATCC90586_012176 [Pythium insidiosum]
MASQRSTLRAMEADAAVGSDSQPTAGLSLSDAALPAAKESAGLRRQTSSSLSTLASTPTPPASSRELEPQDSMRSRGRACVPAEKHVTFRVTPSVRYFKSSQSASFADDDASHEDAASPRTR